MAKCWVLLRVMLTDQDAGQTSVFEKQREGEKAERKLTQHQLASHHAHYNRLSKI